MILCLASAPGARAAQVRAGALRAEAHATPWELAFTNAGGSPVLREAAAAERSSAAGTLGFERGGRWAHATRAVGGHMAGRSYVATLRTDDPRHGEISVRIAPISDGVLRVIARGPLGATEMGIGFARGPGESFLGFGERSDAVVRTAGVVHDRVAEGPYQPSEEPGIAAAVPAAGYDPRPDATYFPIPWLLSSRGYGLRLEGSDESWFTLGRPWSVRARGRRLGFRVYAGPRPADALRRFTADVGRQPPAAAPFYFGPWWQPYGDPAANVELLRKSGGGALGSLVQTYTHYLPCGSQQGRTADERRATSMFHRAGLAVTTYFNPMICTGYSPRFGQADQARLLTQDRLGASYLYRYTGSTRFLVGQFDFSNPSAARFYDRLLGEAVANGYDGWMEDFGEYTPDDSVSHDGMPGPEMHNLYPVLYHAAAYAYARRAPRPLARFNRSGWTGAARVSQLVWGGDPSTTWGFDGLRSAIFNGLTMGASGVSLWGSDIGGYFSLSTPPTTADLERRWIELGFASGVMRTEANGFPSGSATRAQIFDPAVLPTWVRYARLRTQMEPYLAAAERTYDATGLPLMRQLMLIFPGDARAAASDDEYMLGRDLLVAPVVEPGAVSRRLYLPPGRWVDFWRSVSLGRDGAPTLRAPVTLDGARTVRVPAPADQLPIFVRDGAALGLLPADVQTLSAYGRRVVRLRDRANRRTLLAWPAPGARAATASLAEDAMVSAALSRSGAWTLRVRQRRPRRIDLQVVLPRRPCRLLANGHPIQFRYAQDVLTASVRLEDGELRAAPQCDQHTPVRFTG